MRTVMLATPAYSGQVEVEYTHALVQSIRACADFDINLKPVWWPGEALVQHARNMLVGIAIESKVDNVLFVDSDQSWQPQEAVALLRHPVDVVGAPVRRKSDSVEEYNVRVAGSEIRIDEATGLWQVSAIGTGFLSVSRKALQAVWDRSKPYRKGDQNTRMVFDVPVIDGELWGEDTIFCQKLTDAGFPIHVDPSFVVAHHGAKKYTGSFLNYIDQLRAPLRVVA